MADVKHQPVTDIPFTNPMNLTCKAVSGGEPVPDDGGVIKYAIIIDVTGTASAPNNYTTTVFQSTEAYELKSSDGTISWQIPAGGLGIYSK